MNSFSEVRRFLAMLVVIVAGMLVRPPSADALSVHAVYRTACSREVGVILRVEKRDIYLLRLDGSLVKIPRHEIVSLLYYPVSQLPLAQVPTPPDFPPLKVTTRQNGKVVDLVTGWPVDYSDNQISFLLRNGKELVIDRTSIWSLEYQDDTTAASPTANQPVEALEFVQPQTSSFCSDGKAPPAADAAPTPAAAAPRQVFAQQILNDQIVIRRELDRLMEGYQQVKEYEGDQKFYPEPFIYRNRTMLGIWVSEGSRYGASSTRSNNYAPLLVDELTLGPFRYQHVLLSGSAPNDLLLHQESQSQIYYRFKAAYFHTSIFLDPNIVLVGEKYPWSKSDVSGQKLDDRLVEVLAIEFGFDWGPLSIELAPAVVGQVAVKTEDFFDSYDSVNLWRAGFRLTFGTWRLQVNVGHATASEFAEKHVTQGGNDRSNLYNTSWKYAYARANLMVEPIDRLELTLSAVYRHTSYTADPDDATFPAEAYAATSVSTALRGSFALSNRFSVGANVIVEVQSREAAMQGSASRVLPRFAIFTGFWF